MGVETPPFRVRYAETDAQGVAYYGSYFTWWEVGELHFLETLGLRAPQLDHQGIMLAAAEAYARFLRPAVYDDLVAVRVRLAQAAPKRVLLETELVRAGDGVVLARGRMARVLVGPAGKALPIPENLLVAAEERVERIVVSERAEQILAPTPPGARQDTQELRVRYAETDAQGVAYFGSYFAWFEAGRNELTRAVGLPYRELERQGTYLPVSEAFCRYLSPLRPREVFRITTAVPILGHAKMVFTNRIASADGRREIAAGYTVHGCTGRDGRPRPLPPEVLQRFALAGGAGMKIRNPKSEIRKNAEDQSTNFINDTARDCGPSAALVAVILVFGFGFVSDFVLRISSFRHPILTLLGLAMCLVAASAEGFTVDSDFPGGNAIIEKIEGDEVVLHQDLRDTAGHWFWWHFRVRGAAGRTLTFRFTNGNVIGVRGPAVSNDGGRTWAWLGAAAVKGQSFTYTFPADVPEVRFCFAIPYFEANLKAFLGRWQGNPHLRVLALCKSRKGRDVERLHVGKLEPPPTHRILLAARHHCCESLASFAMEGVAEAMLADTEDGRWFRQHVEAMLIPFVDKDGVEDGDQGKNRRPRDHNRDYDGEGIYPETRAIRELVPKWADGRLRLALDLHCPHIRGAYNEVIYIVGSENPEIWEQQCAFGKILEAVRTGPLPYKASDNLPFGKAWNTKGNCGAGKSFSRWAGELPGVRLAASFEIPYANAGGETVTAEAARAFGRDLAKAIRQYLEAAHKMK